MKKLAFIAVSGLVFFACQLVPVNKTVILLAESKLSLNNITEDESRDDLVIEADTSGDRTPDIKIRIKSNNFKEKIILIKRLNPEKDIELPAVYYNYKDSVFTIKETSDVLDEIKVKF